MSEKTSAKALSEWPLWEVFVRNKAGLDHKHCGSLHAPDAKMALQMARDVYTRRQEGVSLWVVPSSAIVASSGVREPTLMIGAGVGGTSTTHDSTTDPFGSTLLTTVVNCASR